MRILYYEKQKNNNNIKFSNTHFNDNERIRK